MLNVTLRQPTTADWPGIHHVANAALPWADDENQTWLANRKRFAQSHLVGRSWVAEGADGQIAGYAAIEGEPTPDRFRMFLVMGPELLYGGLGELLYEQLARDLRELEAHSVWAREEARDTALLGFLQERGFTEARRFTVSGVEMVLLECGIEQNPTAFTD